MILKCLLLYICKLLHNSIKFVLYTTHAMKQIKIVFNPFISKPSILEGKLGLGSFHLVLHLPQKYFKDVFCSGSENVKKSLHSFQLSVAFHIETSHLICSANLMSGFCMECNTRLKWVKSHHYIFGIEKRALWLSLKRLTPIFPSNISVLWEIRFKRVKVNNIGIYWVYWILSWADL